MDSSEIPERSNLWLDVKDKVESPWYLLDTVTVMFALFIGLFSAIIYWPSVSTFAFQEVFFTPLIPVIAQGLSIFKLSFNDSLKIIYTFSFGLSTVSLYLLVRDMTKKQLTAILSASIFLIPAVPVFFLTNFFPEKSSELYLSAYSFFSIVYGDSAIFLSLSFIPLIIIFFNRYLSHSTFYYFGPTVILCSLVLLLSRTQSLNMLLILLIVVFNSLLLGMARLKLRRLFFVTIFSIGLVTFWYTPTFWLNTFILNGVVGQNLRYIFPLPLILGILGLFFSFVFFGKKEERRLIFIAFLVFTLFGVISADWLINKHSFVPYPHRLIPNISMFGSIVLALTITSFLDKFQLISSWRMKIRSKILKVIVLYAFAITSFIILGFLAFVSSPAVLHFLANGTSPWQIIKREFIIEKHQALAMAGGNFQLVKVDASSFQLILGAGITAAFLIWLIFLICYEVLRSMDNNKIDENT